MPVKEVLDPTTPKWGKKGQGGAKVGQKSTTSSYATNSAATSCQQLRHQQRRNQQCR
jgi:hypothetical protein